MSTNPPQFQPPPTYAPLGLESVDPATGEKRLAINPLWLKWFLDIAGLITDAGGGGDNGALGDVRGPSVAVDGTFALFDKTTGKLLKGSAKSPADFVVGPASAADGNLAVFDGTTGKLIKDGGTPASGVGNVVGPASSVNNTVAAFNGTTGKLLKQAPISFDGVTSRLTITQGMDASGQIAVTTTDIATFQGNVQVAGSGTGFDVTSGIKSGTNSQDWGSMRGMLFSTNGLPGTRGPNLLRAVEFHTVVDSTTTLNSAATWSAVTTYALGDFVLAGGNNYRSLQAGNLNHDPSVSPTWWKFVPSASWVMEVGLHNAVANATSSMQNVGIYLYADASLFSLIGVMGDCGLLIGGADGWKYPIRCISPAKADLFYVDQNGAGLFKSLLTVTGATASGTGTIGSAAVVIGDASSVQVIKMGVNTAVGSYGVGWIQYSKQGTAHADLALNPLGGNVGIGTATPNANAKLEVNGASMNTPVLVANLPTGAAGMRHFVTDATATTFNSVVAGGGANGVPVFHDGTNWRIG